LHDGEKEFIGCFRKLALGWTNEKMARDTYLVAFLHTKLQKVVPGSNIKRKQNSLFRYQPSKEKEEKERTRKEASNLTNHSA
jgi:hypothetical protein